MRVLASYLALAWFATHAAGTAPKDESQPLSPSAAASAATASSAGSTIWTARVTRPMTTGVSGFPNGFSTWTGLNRDPVVAGRSARQACAWFHTGRKTGTIGCTYPAVYQFSAKELACEMISLERDGGYEKGNKHNHCIHLLKYDGLVWASQCPDKRKHDAKCYVGDVKQCDGCIDPPRPPPVDWKDDRDAGRRLAIRFTWDKYHADFIGYGRSNAAALNNARAMCWVGGVYSGMCEGPPASAEALDSSRTCTMVDMKYIGWGRSLHKHDFCTRDFPKLHFDGARNFKGARYRAGGTCYIGDGCAALVPLQL